MEDFTSGMVGILPPLFVGGAGLMMVDRFMRQPYQEQGDRRPKRRRGCFDRQEDMDLRPRGRGMGFGNFSNVGW